MKRQSNLLFIILLFLAITTYGQTGSQPTFRIANWYNNKSAAVSLTFDDNLSGQFQYALPSLNNHGFKGTFFIITGSRGNPLNWADPTNALSSGHEIGSHTVTHSDLRNSGRLVNYELQASHDSIEARLANYKCKTIAWPLGSGGGSRPSEKLIRDTAKQFYIGARNASIGPKGYELPNVTNYYQIGANLIGDFMTDTSFANTVDSAITHNGWYVALYHAIENAGYSLVHAQKFNNQLDTLEKRRENLWVAPFGEVMQYHRQRQASTLSYDSSFSGSNLVYNLSLTDTLQNNPLFGHPITIYINSTNSDTSNLLISQGGSIIPVNVDNNTGKLFFNAIPNAGPIEIRCPLLGTSKNELRQMQLYPNPAQGAVKISWISILPGDAYIKIVNSIGQEVISKTVISTESNKQVSIHLDNIPSGIYSVLLQSGLEKVVKKLIIN